MRHPRYSIVSRNLSGIGSLPSFLNSSFDRFTYVALCLFIIPLLWPAALSKVLLLPGSLLVRSSPAQSLKLSPLVGAAS